MLTASPEGVPKSSVTGMNTKLTGRVAPVEAIKSPVVKQAAEHQPIEKQAAEKTASIFRPKETLTGMQMMGQHAALAGAAVVGTALAGAAVSKVHSLINQPMYDRALARAIELNPRLSKIPAADLKSYFGLIVEASPSVAKNPLLVSNYLEYLVDHQGQLNYTAYSNLVNLEGQVLSNKSNSNPLTASAQKAMVDGTIKGIFNGINAESEAHLVEQGRARGFREGEASGMATGEARGREQGLRDGRNFGYNAARAHFQGGEL